MRAVTLQGACGAVLAGLGGTVMAGWSLEVPAIVQLRPDFAPMMFSTACSLAALGSALMLPVSGAGRRAAGAIGGAVFAVALLVLGEHAFGFEVTMLPRLHGWLRDANPLQGQMAASSAVALTMASVAVML